MGWRILLLTVAACGGMVVHGRDGGLLAPAEKTMAATPTEALDSSIDFVCPPEPLNEGTACTMPTYEQCKYYRAGAWMCLVCDKTGHWARVDC
jgi:hypothetical protein